MNIIIFFRASVSWGGDSSEPTHPLDLPVLRRDETETRPLYVSRPRPQRWYRGGVQWTEYSGMWTLS